MVVGRRLVQGSPGSSSADLHRLIGYEGRHGSGENALADPYRCGLRLDAIILTPRMVLQVLYTADFG